MLTVSDTSERTRVEVWVDDVARGILAEMATLGRDEAAARVERQALCGMRSFAACARRRRLRTVIDCFDVARRHLWAELFGTDLSRQLVEAAVAEQVGEDDGDVGGAGDAVA